MQQSRLFISLLSVCLCSLSVSGQTTTPDFNHYRLDKTVAQNNSIFRYWTGTTDSTNQKLIIERISNKNNIILYDGFINDGEYTISDRNNDGYKDFITTYHDFDVIHFFEPITNNFKEVAVYMPSTFGSVNNAKHIRWGYRDAQYAEAYDYSILYKYVGLTPHIYYKIVYKTPDGHSGRKSVTKIELYKFKKRKDGKPLFVRELTSKNPARFDYKKFWRTNYKQLLRYR